MAVRPEFRKALELLAKAIGRIEARGMKGTVLVGGAAVELFTGGAITSGDFDLVSPWKDELFAELGKLGFVQPNRPGWLSNSLLHPDLGLSVQVVSGKLMDGLADQARIREIDLGPSGRARVIPVEDLIADRMAQGLAGRPVRKDMQNQAVRLYQLAEGLDDAYLDKRIREETGNDASLATLREWAAS